MTAVDWPAAHVPQGADLHVVNDGHSSAPPELVWAWLVRPDRWSEHYANARIVRHRSGAWPELRVGSTFTWVTFGAPVSTVVSECEPYSRLTWTGSGLGSVGCHGWVLAPDDQGGTLIHTAETQRGRAIRILRPVLKPAMRSLNQRWIEGLARAAESGRLP
jgi:uncharacterized protein YndB with AHSA1/START domain